MMLRPFFGHGSCFSSRSLVLILGACAVLGACTKKEGATQVVARVGSDEISVHEVNAVLAKIPESAGVDAEQARHEVLEKLIDQRLAADQAINNKLDRSPAVVLALEQAKHDILAQAYIRQVLARQPKPSAVDINRYYDEHPVLFAQRRIYTLRELDIKPAGAAKSTLAEMATQGKTLDEIAAWLQTNKITFQTGNSTHPAEQLPMNLLDKLQSVKDGGIVTLETPGDDFHVLQIVSSQPAPLGRTEAQTKIEQFLINEQAQQAVADELKRLRTVTKIEYVGDLTQAPAAQQNAKSGAKRASNTQPAPATSLAGGS
jgi:EpsD family peptidyl-prolyl cis-trans isomerase